MAAYLLDHDRFARVPHTVMVRMAHPAFHVTQQQRTASTLSLGDADTDAAAALPATAVPCKLGSLQQFVPHDCDTSEMGASRFRWAARARWAAWSGLWSARNDAGNQPCPKCCAQHRAELRKPAPVSPSPAPLLCPSLPQRARRAAHWHP